MERNVTLSIFFCGTNGRIERGYTQISLFYQKCRGFVLKEDDDDDIDLNQSEYKMAFDGCGIVAGPYWGGIFGYGLREQCGRIADKIRILQGNGKKVSIMGLGLSRGAIALLMLAKILQADFPEVKLNLVLFDPVPGNSIYQAKMDLLGLTNTSLSSDLSECTNLKRVLSLYTVKPMPDFILHAPLIPTFSRETEAEYDAIPGEHQGAFFDPHSGKECNIAYFMVREKLEEYGMPLEMETIQRGHLNALWECLEDCFGEKDKTERYTHSRNNVLIARELEGTYLNKYHQRMALKMGDERKVDNKSLYQCFLWTP